jgi:hypothetical protein
MNRVIFSCGTPKASTITPGLYNEKKRIISERRGVGRF